MHFYSLLCDYSDELILGSLFNLYPDEKINEESYKLALSSIRSLDPVDAEGIKLVAVPLTDPIDDSVVTCVTGYFEEDDLQVGLAYQDWAKWLGMEIAPRSLIHYSCADFLASCLFEMTFISFNEQTICTERLMFEAGVRRRPALIPSTGDLCTIYQDRFRETNLRNARDFRRVVS